MEYFILNLLTGLHFPNLVTDRVLQFQNRGLSRESRKTIVI